MRLEGDFYQVEERTLTEKGFYARLVLRADHPIYEGHFPTQGVVPGVCTLTLVREQLAQVLGAVVRFSAIRECKFVAALLPREGLTLDLDTEVGAAGDLRCTASSDGEVVLKLRATWEKIA